MQKVLLALLVVGFFATELLAGASSVMAADIAVTRVSKAPVRAYKRLKVVRDYDGTPVVVRRGRLLGPGYDGSPTTMSALYHAPVMRPQPLYYFNGQPVRSYHLVRWRS
jgi:hypothetical protein